MAANTALVGIPFGSSGVNINEIRKEKFSFLFSAAPTGETATYSLSIPAGLLLDVKVKFGATAPNSLTVTITDDDGVVILTGTLTDSGIIVPPDGPVPFVGQLTVALSGNTSANALGHCMVCVN